MKHIPESAGVKIVLGDRTVQFPTNSLIRLKSIIAPGGPLPISKSSWWAKVRTGEYPKPVKLGPRTTAWRAQDIADLIRRIELEAGHDT